VLNVVDTEGNEVQKLMQGSKQRVQMRKHGFMNPCKELDGSHNKGNVKPVAPTTAAPLHCHANNRNLVNDNKEQAEANMDNSDDWCI
jgi:hypothetical protein